MAFIFSALILLIRTLPSIVWALIWIRVTGPGAFCGVITQSICSIGMISKMYITAIADLDTSILESLDAAGCTAFQKIRYGIMPQLTPNIISTVIYRFDINIKDATTLGIVGAGGIGAALIQCINSRRWSDGRLVHPVRHDRADAGHRVRFHQNSRQAVLADSKPG